MVRLTLDELTEILSEIAYEYFAVDTPTTGIMHSFRQFCSPLLLLPAFAFGNCPNTVLAQQEQVLDHAILKQHTTYFTIADDSFEHADELVSLISEVQFIALGEIHGSQRVSEFTQTLLLLAEQHGFHYLAVETGPYSAKKLEMLAKAGSGALTDFYKKYSSKLFNIYPIPFFINRSDSRFLRVADSLDYELWGLDQEFSFSTRYLLNELAHISEQPLSKEQKELLSKLNSKLLWWYKKEKALPGFDLNCQLRNNELFQSYLNSFDTKQPEVKTILDALKESLEIYCLHENGRGGESNKRRIEYFKTNFTRNYERVLKYGDMPKVILKMGSYHLGRDKSPLKVNDIGQYVQRLAEKNNTQSLHLRFLNRYFKGGADKMNDKDWALSKNFMSVGKKDQWALIDLRKLREDITMGRLQATEFEQREILNYDFMIVMPEDNRKDKHY